MKTIVCDLDGTICENTGGGLEYFGAKPRQDIIDGINKLHDDGHYIIIYTARGMNQFHGDVDQCHKHFWFWTDQWLKKYGVKYNELLFGKPAGDVYIDDKGLRPEEIIKYDAE